MNPNAGPLLHSLNLDPADIDRLRDVSFAKDGDTPVIHILCRTGGGNRADYRNKALTNHPAYIRDEDDGFDSTFAHYYFTIPPAIHEQLEKQGITLHQVIDTETLAEKTERVLASLTPPK